MVIRKREIKIVKQQNNILMKGLWENNPTIMLNPPVKYLRNIILIRLNVFFLQVHRSYILYIICEPCMMFNYKYIACTVSVIELNVWCMYVCTGMYIQVCMYVMYVLYVCMYVCMMYV